MGKTWKELGVWRRSGRSKRSKKGKKAKAVRFVSFSQNEGLKGEERRRRRKGTVVELENLGMKVEWVDGKVYIHRNYRNGQSEAEVYSSFNELRVPSRKSASVSGQGVGVRQTRPNAVYAERNGVRYYFFPQIGVAVRASVAYWPDTEVQPPEHLFGAATPQEVAEAVKTRIESENINISPRADRAYREYMERRWRKDVQRAVDRAQKIVREQRWKKETMKAVDRAVRIVARQNGVELPGDIPVSQALIEEMREMGFEVKVKVKA